MLGVRVERLYGLQTAPDVRIVHGIMCALSWKLYNFLGTSAAIKVNTFAWVSPDLPSILLEFIRDFEEVHSSAMLRLDKH